MGEKGAGGVLIVALVPVVMFALLLWVLFFGSTEAAACGVGSASQLDVAGLTEDAQVAGYDREQLANAVLISNAAIALGLPPAAQTLGVQAAIGESTLRALDNGDAVGPDSRGLFQQRDNGAWGTYADRMDPTISATNFFKALQGVTGWEELEPTIAINKVQHNADPNHYREYRTDAVTILGYLTGVDTTTTGGGCVVSGDAQALAADLVTMIDSGKLTFIETRYANQVRDVAAGTSAANCGIDVRILQIITIATQTFDTVGVSDINRACTGVLVGAGVNSFHYANGGGRAVDFYSFNGSPAVGADGNSMKLLAILDPIVPARTGVGQIECRPATTYAHLFQFEDPCTHLHLDVGNADGPLIFG